MDVVDVPLAEDASADAPEDAPPEPTPTPLPPARIVDLVVRALSNGGFSLVVGGRTLLSSPGGPAGAQRYNERVEYLFGGWRFNRTSVREERPARNATLAVERDAIVLTTRSATGPAQSVLRFTRPSMDEVHVRAEVTGATEHKATMLHFACEPASHFLGFGEQFNDVDHRGRAFSLFVSEQGLGRNPASRSLLAGSHETTYFPVPFFLDPRGFALSIDTDARTMVDLCAANPDEFTLAPEQPEALTLRLYTGPTVADVMRQWTVVQGRSSVPPAWAVEGTWLGLQGGPTAVRGAIDRAVGAGVPVSVAWVQDWIGPRTLGLGNVDIRYHWTADTAHYPDLAGMISSLNTQGIRFLGYFNPFVLQDEDQWAEAARDGHLPRAPDRDVPVDFPLPHGISSMVDLTSTRATQWFQSYADRAITLGMRGWMQDYGEWLPIDARLSDGRDARRFHNRYPIEWHRAARTALQARYPDGDWVMFTRSGWLGEGQVAQIVWAGDQEASFSEHDGLPTVVPAMVSLGMAGISYIAHDIGGYFGGPSTKELYLRWVELAAFTPIFRTHEGLQRDLNWTWDRDAETLRFFSRFARVHRALAPEINAAGTAHQRTGMPIVRALALEFADDPRVYGLRDEYMLGDSLLVAPVVTAGATSRRVYFPRGTWFSVWDPTLRIEGPIERDVPAPLGSPPVFSRGTPRMDLRTIL